MFTINNFNIKYNLLKKILRIMQIYTDHFIKYKFLLLLLQILLFMIRIISYLPNFTQRHPQNSPSNSNEKNIKRKQKIVKANVPAIVIKKNNEKLANNTLKNFKFLKDDQQILYKALQSNLLGKRLTISEQKFFNRVLKITVKIKGIQQYRQFTLSQLFTIFKERNQQKIKKHIIEGCIAKIIRQFMQLYYQIQPLIIEDRSIATFHEERFSVRNKQNKKKHLYSKSYGIRQLDADNLNEIYQLLFESYQKQPLESQFSSQEKTIVQEVQVASIIKKKKKQYFIEQQTQHILNIRDQIKKLAQDTFRIVNS